MNEQTQPHLFDSIQGYYTTILLLRLCRLGVLKEMDKPRNVKSLAEIAEVDLTAMKGILEFLASSTDSIKQPRKGFYKLETKSYSELLFNLEKFAGAYGPATEVFGGKPTDNSFVNYQSLAAAFVEIANFAVPFVPEMIYRSEVRYLLDLGCGTGSMLIDLCGKDANLRALGLDSSLSMCRFARQAVSSAGLDSQISIRYADAGNPAGKLSEKEQRKIDGIYGRSFLNEFFCDGHEKIVKVLNLLHNLFPDRKAWFVDYFGQIGYGNTKIKRQKLGLLQDIAQIVSGQGVPPSNTNEWRKIYKKAECRLQEVHEFETPDIRWFIHEVIL